MTRLFQNYQRELEMAQAQDAVRSRAQMVAASFTPSMLENLQRQVYLNPTLPADAHLAVAMDPQGESLFENLSIAYVQNREPQVGERVPAARLASASVPPPMESEEPRSRLGRLWGAVGGATESVLGVTESATRSVLGDTGYGALKGVTRNVMPVLDFGQQSIQAGGRYAAAGVNDLFEGDWSGAAGNFGTLGGGFRNLGDQTDYGQMLQTRVEQGRQLLSGEEVTAGRDLGTGFFFNQESETVQRRVAAERAMGTLPNGQTYTIGRTAATWSGLDPEGTAYNVMSGVIDGAIAVAAPGPEQQLALGLNKARSLRTEFFGGVDEAVYMSSVGTSRGLRTQFDINRARDFLSGERSANLVETLAGESSWARIDRWTSGKLDPYTVSNLADATDPDDVRRILLAAAETGQRPTLATPLGRRLDAVGESIGEFTPGIRRLGGKMPPNSVDLEDGRQAVDAIRDFGLNGKAPQSVIDTWTELMGRARNNVERREAYSTILGDAAEVFAARKGVSPERARAITKYAREEAETSRALWEDMISADRGQWSNALIRHLDETGVGGVDLLPGVSVLAETAKGLPLPSARDISRAVGWSAKLWEAAADPTNANRFMRVLGPSWEATVSSLSFMQGRLWKDTRLFRLGYPLRVLPEEQLRRVADGQTILSSPASVFTNLLDPRLNGDIDGLMGRFLRLFDDSDAALPPPSASDFVSNAPRTGVRSLTGDALTDNAYYQAALADERLSGLRGSDASMVQGELTRFVKVEPSSGTLSEDYLAVLKDELMTLGSDPVMTRLARKGVDETLADLAGSPTGNTIRQKLIALDPSMADDLTLRQYLESMSARIDAVTGGNEQLLSVIQSGKWPDLSGDKWRALAMEAGPDAVTGRNLISGDMSGIYDRITGPIFDLLAAKPTNKLSRSPVWLEQYERNLIELAQLANNPDELLRAAAKANVRESTMDVLRRTAKGEGELNVAQISDLASYGAMQHVKGLLYDTTQSSQFFDQMRLMMPFGEAWKEVVTTWAKLVSRDPFTTIRRAGQTGRALQSPEFGQTYGDVVGLDGETDEGFFYTNAFGDEVFYYPLSRELMQAGTGMPWRLEGSARSLNLIGEVFPSVGPVGGHMVEWFLPDDTAWDGVREQLFPYGPPPTLRDGSTWMPAWMNTMLFKDDPLTRRQQLTFANTQFAVARTLYSENPERYQGQGGAQLLYDDATPIASRVFFVRGVAQGFSPASPQVTPANIGPNDELLDQWVMADKYQKLLEEDPSTALERFLELYGQGSLLVTQGNTKTTVYGGSPLEGAGYDWVRDNPQVADEHPQIYGFFAPTGDGSDFSSEAYDRSLEIGERVELTFDQKVALAEDRQARMIYQTYRDAIEGTPNEAQRAQLGVVKEQLREMFPGYERVETVGGRDAVWRIIEGGDVDRALADPTTANTPVGEALSAYWDYRAQVVAAAEAAGLGNANGGGWRTNNDGKQYRDLLRIAGEEAARQEPEFARMWDLFLVREFKNDDIEDVSNG